MAQKKLVKRKTDSIENICSNRLWLSIGEPLPLDTGHTHILSQNQIKKKANDIVNDQWFIAIALKRKPKYNRVWYITVRWIENCVSAKSVSTLNLYYVWRSNDKRNYDKIKPHHEYCIFFLFFSNENDWMFAHHSNKYFRVIWCIILFWIS